MQLTTYLGVASAQINVFNAEIGTTEIRKLSQCPSMHKISPHEW